MDKLPIGHLFAEKFEIISVLGSGGMGVVYKARQIEFDRIVALKVLPFESVATDAANRRFEREARLLSKLTNKHICRFYYYGNNAGKNAYIVMEHIEGRSLKQIILEKEKIGWRQAIKICREVCNAMADAHELGIIHRDLKPDNIMLVANDSNAYFVKLIDFGLGKFLTLASGTQASFTQTGELLGSVNYISPEQCKGMRADNRSDVYALGCILYEMLTGLPPFEADNPVTILYMHANNEMLVASKAGMPSDAPMAIDKVIQMATVKDPDMRYQTMREFDHDLELIESGQDALLTSSHLPKRAVRKSGWHFVIPMAVATTLLLLLYTFNSEKIQTGVARVSLSVQPSEKNMLNWIDIADRVRDDGKTRLAQDIIEQVMAAMPTHGSRNIKLSLAFARHQFKKGRLKSASFWSQKSMHGVATALADSNRPEKAKIGVYISEAGTLMLESTETFTKADLDSMLNIYKLNYCADSAVLNNLTARMIESLKPRLNDVMFGVLSSRDRYLAKEGKFNELEGNFQLHKDLVEKAFGNNSACMLDFFLTRAICAKDAGNSTKANELFHQALHILQVCSNKNTKDYFDALGPLQDWYAAHGELAELEQVTDEIISNAAAPQNAVGSAYLRLASLNAAQRKYTKSVDLACKSKEIFMEDNFNDPYSIVAASELAASSLMSLNRRDEAVKEIQSTLKRIEPSAPPIEIILRLNKELSRAAASSDASR